MLSDFLLNPAVFINCIISVFVFILILRPPKWLGHPWPNATLIAGLIAVGSIVSLYTIRFQTDFQGLWRLSLVLSLACAALTYVYRGHPSTAFKIVCVSFMIIFWSLISYKMLRTATLLDTDERHYLSIAAVATGGHGLYPALQNYPSIPAMGGIGYLAWIYVAAYQILGPYLSSLRLVALMFSFLSLPPIFLLFRRWYGSVTAWLAVTLLPTTLLYITVFSIRMDIFTITCLWWALLLVDVAREKNTTRWHLAAGLFLGLCLQAHIHTSVTTIAVGILYLIDYGRQVRRTRQWAFPGPVAAYSIGALMGLGVFVIVNVLPNPDAFFRTAGNAARFAVVAANPDAPLIERLVRSFTAIDVFADSFLRRWVIVFQNIYPVELIIWIAAFLRIFRRRTDKVALTTIILSISALVVGFFILNHYVLIYTTHMGPLLLLCVPPFFTYGFSRRTTFEWADVTPSLVLVLSVCVLPIYMISVRISDYTVSSVPPVPEEAITIDFVKAHVSTNCKVMGSDNIFIYDLPMYTWYHTGDNAIGRRYYNFDSDAELWVAVSPDIVIENNEILESLRQWIILMNYEEIGPAVWRKTHEPLSADCTISP